MIEAIKEIGESVLEKEGKDKFLEDISIPVSLEKNGKKQHVVILDFNTKKQELHFDIKEIDEESGRKYLWMKNAPGSNDDQDRATTNTLEFLVSQTIPNLYKKLPESTLKNDLKLIRKNFFYDLGEQEKSQKRYRFVLSIEKLNFSDDGLDEIIQDAKQKNKAKYAKATVKPITKNVLDEIKKQTGLNKNEISLFTIKINNRLVTDYGEYKQYHTESLIDNLFGTETGNCYLCMAESAITQNTAKLEFNYYITDKKGFSSNLDGKFTKNFNLCKTCYKDLMVGERFIQKNLRFYIGGLRVYIIPKLVFSNNKTDIKRISGYITDLTNSVSNINSIRKFTGRLSREEKNNFLINYLFYKPDQKAMKILKLIQDVPPTRLDDIRKVEEDMIDLINERYSGNFSYKIDLQKIYNSIPIEDSGDGRKVAHRKYLDIIDSIFSDRKIEYGFLIDQFTEVMRIIRFNRQGFNVSIKPNTKRTPDQILTDKSLQLNFLLLFFNKLNLLRGGRNLDTKNSDLESMSSEINQYWQDIEIYNDKHKRALFLLGYLIGQVGSEQSNAGHVTKPILNKINFQGMDISRISNLSNEVLEKLRQYKILHFNENVFAAFKNLLDKNIHDWQPSNQENVFYLLSGYAFVSFLRLKGSKEKAGKLIRETFEKIEKAKQRGENITEIESKFEEAKKLLENHKYSDTIKKLKEIKIEEGGPENE